MEQEPTMSQREAMQKAFEWNKTFTTNMTEKSVAIVNRDSIIQHAMALWVTNYIIWNDITGRIMNLDEQKKVRANFERLHARIFEEQYSEEYQVARKHFKLRWEE